MTSPLPSADSLDVLAPLQRVQFTQDSTGPGFRAVARTRSNDRLFIFSLTVTSPDAPPADHDRLLRLIAPTEVGFALVVTAGDPPTAPDSPLAPSTPDPPTLPTPDPDDPVVLEFQADVQIAPDVAPETLPCAQLILDIAALAVTVSGVLNNGDKHSYPGPHGYLKVTGGKALLAAAGNGSRVAFPGHNTPRLWGPTLTVTGLKNNTHYQLYP